MNKMSLDQVQMMLTEDRFTLPPGDWDLYNQLYDLMRENQSLKEDIELLQMIVDTEKRAP